MKTAPADGYTLMFTISTTMIMNRVLYKSLPYDPDKDFVLISCMSSGGLPLVASKATGATNLKEFVEYARKNKVSIGTYAAGSTRTSSVAELNKHFGLQMEAVHYRGEAPMWQDLAAGVIQAASGSYAAASNVLQSGAGRAIAVPQITRMSKLPDVATFLEQGVTSKAFQLKGFICAVGPAGMPQETRAAPVGPDGRRRQERARAEAARHLRHRRSRRSGTRSSASSTTRRARSGSASSRASA